MIFSSKGFPRSTYVANHALNHDEFLVCNSSRCYHYNECSIQFISFSWPFDEFVVCNSSRSYHYNEFVVYNLSPFLAHFMVQLTDHRADRGVCVWKDPIVNKAILLKFDILLKFQNLNLTLEYWTWSCA